MANVMQLLCYRRAFEIMKRFKNYLLVYVMFVLALYLFCFDRRLVYSIVEPWSKNHKSSATSLVDNNNNNNNLQHQPDSNSSNRNTNSNNNINDNKKNALNDHQKQANDVLKAPKKSSPTVQVKEQTAANLKPNCSWWKITSHLEIPEDPLIKLHPNLYLYPGLDGGPNNQIKGFYQAMYLAIRLNRFVAFVKSI